MPENRRIVVAGATGTIGKVFCKNLIGRGYDVIVFSRNFSTKCNSDTRKARSV